MPARPKPIAATMMNGRTRTVSVVIPTVGRVTLRRAIESALGQTYPPIEIIVVADTEACLSLPEDDRVVVLPVGPGLGASRCRQVGVEKARGDVIALLDDDDIWLPQKLRQQLGTVGALDGPWVVSGRIRVCGPGDRHRVWPRRLIAPRQDVADYLFRRAEVGSGGTVLQTSTLCFPTTLGRAVPLDAEQGVHDEATWLMEAQHSVPGLRIIHLPDVLSEYHVRGESLSRPREDRSAEYVSWGVRHLVDESARVRGDYLCTSPVSVAVSATSLRGVATAIWAAGRYGRPGPYALAYASAGLVRITARRARLVVGRGRA